MKYFIAILFTQYQILGILHNYNLYILLAKKLLHTASILYKFYIAENLPEFINAELEDQ